MTTQLDSFEARLLTELRSTISRSEEAARTSLPASRRRRRALTAAALVAAATVVGVVLVPGLGTEAAYSVQEGNAGEIEVEVHRPEDADGLERALAEHGISADVTYLPTLQTCAEGRYEAVDREVGLSLAIGKDLVRVTLPPGAVRDGETFVMALSVVPLTSDELAETSEREGHRAISGASTAVSADVATGPVGPCRPVAAPGS